MELNYIIAQMALQAETIHNFVQGISSEQARWKPDERSWSILEVVNHLYDEEREDFRPHLDFLLHQADRLMPNPIDPEGWVVQRHYNQRDLGQSIAQFSQERKASLAWLGALSGPNLTAAYEFPFGTLRAGDMLAAWVAHDLLHTRQLVELQWAYTVEQMKPYPVVYAGDW